MATEAQRRAVEKYKAKCARVVVEFTPAERELYEWLCHTASSKQRYIKALLREVKRGIPYNKFLSTPPLQGFEVIDPLTGVYPDIEQIALREQWAAHLHYCDMEGFYISEEGELILGDECGHFAYCPSGRFVVREAAESDPT